MSERRIYIVRHAIAEDIDLFTNPSSTISTLHALSRKVICYFEAPSLFDVRHVSSYRVNAPA
jgi:hypothetical protein